jgi:hypothetical protein
MKEIKAIIEDDLYKKLQSFAIKTYQGDPVREAIICYLAQMGVIDVKSDRFNYK